MLWLNTYIEDGALWLRDHTRNEVFYLCALDIIELHYYTQQLPRVLVNREQLDPARDLAPLRHHFLEAFKPKRPQIVVRSEAPPPPPRPPPIVPSWTGPIKVNPPSWAERSFPRTSWVDSKLPANKYEYFEPEAPATPLDRMLQDEATRLLDGFIKRLPPRHAWVMQRRLAGIPLRNIGVTLSVGAERIRQIEINSVQRLRKMMQRPDHRVQVASLFELIRP